MTRQDKRDTDEVLRDIDSMMSAIYARLAGMADDKGDVELRDELMRKSFDFDLKSNS